MKRPSPASMADSPDFPPTAPPIHRMKKTRELPNLSDCNCCNRHINSTNPKNRLQILASEWRIVLLCKCCYNLVESSQYCSHCLTRVSSSSMESFHECKRCRRRVHKACASMFPFGSGNDNNCCDDFSVCFDCWVPKLIENDYKARVLGSKIKSKVAKTGGDLTNSFGSSGVCDSQDMGRGEDAFNDVHVVAQKKVAAACEAKEKTFNKVMDATKAIAVASRAVGLVSVDRGGDQQGSAVDVDAQLAFRLHRAMNSSPWISRNLCLLNTQCEDVPEVDGLELQAAIDPSCSSKPSNAGGDGEIGCPETIQDFEHKCARIQDEKQNGDLDGCLITYSRKGRASVEAKGKKEPDSSQRTHCRRWSSGAVKIKEEHDCPLRTYRRRLSKVERCKLELGYYTKTYSRRHSSIPQCKDNLIHRSYKLDNGAPAIVLKCCEESPAFTTAS